MAVTAIGVCLVAQTVMGPAVKHLAWVRGAVSATGNKLNLHAGACACERV
jgi:hypothetical protein